LEPLNCESTGLCVRFVAKDCNSVRRGERRSQLRTGQYSIRINMQWRICFEWPRGAAVALSLCGTVAEIDRSSMAQDGQLRRPPNGRARGGVKSEALAILDAAQSAALRDQLLAELATMTSADRVANWARAALPAKNTLTASDPKLVEDAFEQLLSQLPPFGASPEAIAPTNDDALRVRAEALQQAATAQATVARSVPGQATTGIDKSVLAIAAPRRYRNRDHLRFVARQPCLICGRKPSDPHHLRHMQPVALGRKASDEFDVPLCRTHHRAAHRAGDERAWWKASGIDPIKAARKLWKETRAQEGRLRPNPVARANVSDAKKLASAEQNLPLPDAGGASPAAPAIPR
jgi:hypothetical protein